MRKQTELEQIPYLRIQWSNNDTEIFQIVNNGRGTAINVQFSSFDIPYEEGRTFQIKSRPLLSPGNDGVTAVPAKEFDVGMPENDIKHTLDLLLQSDFKVVIYGTYEDIVKNVYDFELESSERYNDRFFIRKQAKRR